MLEKLHHRISTKPAAVEDVRTPVVVMTACTTPNNERGTMHALLENVTILAGLEEAPANVLCQRAIEGRIKAGNVNLTERQVDDHFFSIRSAAVAVSTSYRTPTIVVRT